MIYHSYFDSPIHQLVLTSDGRALTGLYMIEHKHGLEMNGESKRDDEIVPFIETKRQLTVYFEGRLREFDLPLLMQGTEFQQRVWEELKKIPYGTTITYRELAQRIGNQNGSRAVGLANGRNPISIIVPCHRVIGTNGQLTGYGGGIERKRWLLDHEVNHNRSEIIH